MDDWRTLLCRATERVRSMATGGSSPPGSTPHGSASDELHQLIKELELLDARYEEERARVVLETKRRMADLEELHHANRLVTVGTLTLGMAHEFGTPLGVALARAQMIVADESDLAEARKDAEEIIHQVRRMTMMCREVLDYARPKVPTKSRVDVVQIVRQAMVLLLPEARKRSAKVILPGDPPATYVLGDPSKLMQILTNLIVNAADAMPSGGSVNLTVEKKRIEPAAVHGLPEADYVSVHVRDGGTGIREADLPHIFDTFFTTKKEGSGLGLAVSYRIAREHGGFIGVVTNEGQGSCFTLYLPPLPA